MQREEDDERLWEPAERRWNEADDWSGFVEERGDESLRPDLPNAFERLRRRLSAAWETELEFGLPFLFAPVAFASGSIAYFSAPREPSAPAVLAFSVVALGAVAWYGRQGRMVPVLLALVVLGFASGQLRTARLATVMVERPTVANIAGIVLWSEQRANGSARYTIAVERDDATGGTGLRTVRVVHRKPKRQIKPGDGVELRARLIAPSGPVVPGRYDFAFHAWFAGHGAIGSVLGDPTVRQVPGTSWRVTLARWRYAIGERIADGMSNDGAALAKALVIGDRSGIDAAVAEDLRLSGLAHILAISGLHMMLVTGLVFVTLRKLAAAMTLASLRLPVKKVAACGAFAFAVVYLALSGMNVSTQRAFVMVAIMLGAVLLDRRAATLRNVAVAAFAVLAWQPEAIFSPGFQMSFAAATALVAAHGTFRRWQEHHRATRSANGWFRSTLSWIGGLSATSLIAGFATAPFAAFHFHRVALYSLAANLLAMPVVTFAVMPLAVLSVIAMPFGLEPLVLPLLGYALEGVTWVAQVVASWGGVARFGMTSPAALALYGLGFCVLAFARTELRLVGLLPIALAAVVAERGGRVVAVVNENGRNVVMLDRTAAVLSAGKPESFTNKLVAESFPASAKAFSKFRCDTLGCTHSNDAGVFAMSKDPRSLLDDCQRANLIVARFRVRCPTGSRAQILDGSQLRTRGSALVTVDGSGRFRFEHAYGLHPRPWTQHRHR